MNRYGFRPVKVSNCRKSDLQEVRQAMTSYIASFRQNVLKLCPAEEYPPSYFPDALHNEGRFPKRRRINFDQVPCEFAFKHD